MRDVDVRRAVLADLDASYGHDRSTLIIQELCLPRAEARVDIAVVNGTLTGIELKSDSDTLDRLPAQAEAYSKVFEEVVLVCGASHGDHIGKVIPSWWGITTATMSRGFVALDVERSPSANPSPDPAEMAGLLWRRELLAILEDHGEIDGFRSSTRRQLASRLAAVLGGAALSDCVRVALRGRREWRDGPSPSPDGGSLPRAARWSGSRGRECSRRTHR